MAYLEEALKRKEQELTQLKRRIGMRVQNRTEGTLQVSTIDGKCRYYNYLPASEAHKGRRIYLKSKDRDFIQKLAQREYDERMLGVIEKQLAQIQEMETHYDPHATEKVLTHLHKGKRSLIIPEVLDDEDFCRRWETLEYQGNPYPFDEREYYTERGERVRSKSEILIADRLFRCGIPYRYEAPVQVKNGRLLYPDFSVLNIRTRQTYYWEHFGIMDDPGYVEGSCLRKLNDYREAGIIQGKNLICTFETSNFPLTIRGIDPYIETFLH